MLSARGRFQARECATRFSTVNLAHIFASPFDRTMETASIIADRKGLLVKPEPGLCEVLGECQRPPGFWSTDRLKTKFPLADINYQSIYVKETLPEEKWGDDSCIPRLRRVLPELLKEHEGDLLLVSHGAPIGAIHYVWGSSFTYVGQATVSKFVETNKGVHLEYSGDSSHLSDRSNLRPLG